MNDRKDILKNIKSIRKELLTLHTKSIDNNLDKEELRKIFLMYSKLEYMVIKLGNAQNESSGTSESSEDEA